MMEDDIVVSFVEKLRQTLRQREESANPLVLPDLKIPDLGTLVGLCVPAMGMHAMVEAELDDTELFGASMIVGYYQQALISVEPMISQARLEARQSFVMDAHAVPNAGAVTAWPTGSRRCTMNRWRRTGSCSGRREQMNDEY